MKKVQSKEELLARIRQAPQTLRDLAGNSKNYLTRKPIRTMLDELMAAGEIRIVHLNSGARFALADWKMSREDLEAYILDRCVITADGCHEWSEKQFSGSARIAIDGKRIDVRRTLMRLAGRRLQRGQTVRMKCCNDDCVARAHMVVESTTKALEGRALPLTTRKKVSEAKRAKSKLNWAIVRDIRASEVPSTQLAKDLELAPSTVRAIRSHRLWAEMDQYDSLMRRAA